MYKHIRLQYKCQLNKEILKYTNLENGGSICALSQWKVHGFFFFLYAFFLRYQTSQRG